MHILQNLVFVGAAAQVFGIYLYIKDIFYGQTKPNLATWTLWFVAPMVATAAALSKGVRWSVLPLFLAGLGPFVVIVASIFNKKSYWRLRKVDYICAALSVAALLLWVATKDANLAIIFALLSDGLAGLPTVIKSYHYPETETTLTYQLGIFSAVLSFFAIKQWVFAAYSLPIYLILMNGSLTASAFFGKRKITKHII